MSIAEADPYGVDIAMTAGGDLALTSSGGLAAIGETSVLAQAVWQRVNTQPGELPLHQLFGVSDETGQKMAPAAIAALIGTQLARTPETDSRFESVQVKNAYSPVEGDASALALEVAVVAAGGVAFTISGLPEQVQISEVAPTPSESPLSSLVEETEYEPGEELEAEAVPGSAEAVAEALGELESEL